MESGKRDKAGCFNPWRAGSATFTRTSQERYTTGETVDDLLLPTQKCQRQPLSVKVPERLLRSESLKDKCQVALLETRGYGSIPGPPLGSAGAVIPEEEDPSDVRLLVP